MNILTVQLDHANESVEAKMLATNKRSQQESPVNFIWGEPVHTENLGGAQV